MRALLIKQRRLLELRDNLTGRKNSFQEMLISRPFPRFDLCVKRSNTLRLKSLLHSLLDAALYLLTDI